MSDTFRVIAIIAARNEGDLIRQVIGDLIGQGIEVYLIDDGSSDDTVSEASCWLGHGLIAVEQRPETLRFEWTQILERKGALGASLDADWFIHHDADEFRESPWPNLNLREAIRQVDLLGYNAIDFRLLNFRPTHDEFVPKSDVRAAFRYYEPAANWDVTQVKAWKRGPDGVDLASSGGHEAVFRERRIFPVHFLVRHYPIRSQMHGERKVFADRKPRFAVEELDRGWHLQYRAMAAHDTFIRDASQLTLYDAKTMQRDLQVTHRDSVQRALLESEAADLHSQLVDAEARRSHERTSAEAQATLQHLRLTEAEARIAANREESERVILGLQNEIDAQRGLISSLKDTVEAERTRTADRLRAADASLIAEKAIAAARHQRDTEQILKARAEVQALHDSKSWRITGPLRAAYDFLSLQSTTSGVTTSIDKPDIEWGTLARESPLSSIWGMDRGTPVDRHFIARFLNDRSADISGHVLEVKEPVYTHRFGGSRVTRSSILDVNAANRLATVVGDLSGAVPLPIDAVDCFVLTQTLHIIYDLQGALRQSLRVLRPGGVLLCTFPAVSRVNYEDGGVEGGDYWRLTSAAVRRLFEELPEARDLEIQTYGNVRTCAAFLYGLAAEELSQDVLDFHDPWFPLIHAVRVVKIT